MTGSFTTPRQTGRVAICESLFPIARLHFKVIKCYHHLTTLRTSTPKSLERTASGLVSNLHPAFISDSFRAAAKAAADAWLHAAIEALLSHYSEQIQDAQSEIAKSPLAPDAFDNCLSIAITWSKRQLGKKLKDLDIDEARKRIQASTPFTASILLKPPPPPEAQQISVGPSTRSVSIQTDESSTTKPSDGQEAAPSMPQRAARKRTRPTPAVTPTSSSQDLFASPRNYRRNLPDVACMRQVWLSAPLHRQSPVCLSNMMKLRTRRHRLFLKSTPPRKRPLDRRLLLRYSLTSLAPRLRCRIRPRPPTTRLDSLKVARRTLLWAIPT